MTDNTWLFWLAFDCAGVILGMAFVSNWMERRT